MDSFSQNEPDSLPRFSPMVRQWARYVVRYCNSVGDEYGAHSYATKAGMIQGRKSYERRGFSVEVEDVSATYGQVRDSRIKPGQSSLGAK